MVRYLVLLFVLMASVAHASVDWTLKNTFALEAAPLATAAAADGKTLYFLVPGKVVVYSLAENKVVDFMPVDRKFDRLTVTAKEKTFILSSSKENSISLFERKKVLDVSGLPYLGAAEARVVVAVFSDYQ